jgi:O-antigen/teichoic acid export membrane protein
LPPRSPLPCPSTEPGTGLAAVPDVGSISDDTREATWAAGLLSVAGLVAGVGNLLFNVVVARTGGLEAYGGLGVLLAISTVTGFLATGVQYAIARHHRAGHIAALVLLRRTTLSVWPWLVGTALLLAFTAPISHYLRMSSTAPVVLTGLLSLVTLGGALPSGILLAQKRFVLITALHVGAVMLRIGVGAVLARLMEPTTGSVLATLIPIAVVSLLTFAVVQRESRDHVVVPQPSLEVTSTAVGAEGAVSALYSAALWGLWSLPMVFARHDVAASVSGRFAAAQLVASGVLFLAAPLAMAFYPAIARHRDRRVVRSGLAVTGLVAGGSVLGLAVLGPYFIDRLYGPRFDVTWDLLLSLGFSAFVVALATYGLWAARAMGRLARTAGVVFVVALAAEVGVDAAAHGSLELLALAPGLALAAALAVALPLVMLSGSASTHRATAELPPRPEPAVASMSMSGDG